MSPYLYATMDMTNSDELSYRGIVIEDVREDYQEVARFFAGSFAADVEAYVAWTDAILEKNEAAEIYESDALRDRIAQLPRG